MEIKISEIDIGDVLILPPDWKGYSFDEETNSWVKGSNLYKDEKGNLHPFCSLVHTNRVAKIFKGSPINEDKILIIRGNINDIFTIAYILVGSINIKNYEFETKLLIE